MKKRVLHVVNIFFTIPYFLGDQLRHFSNRNFEEHVVCSHSAELKDYSQKKGFEYKEVNIPREISPLKDLIAIYNTAKYIKKNKIDIVVGHTPKGALISMIASYICRTKKRIYFRHGLAYETSKGVKRKLLKLSEIVCSALSTEIINVSPSVAKKALEENINKPEKQTILGKGTCNGISTEKFNRKNINNNDVKKIKLDLEIDENSIVLGFSGRLVKDKGIIELVNAFESLCKQRDNLTLLLVGMFEEKDKLPEDIIQKIKNSPNIKTTGYVSYEEIENYYAVMDIYILPSYREGFPTSILEASSMGIPVITSKSTGCIDSIINGKTGLFINEINEFEIEKSIKQLLDNKTLMTDLGENGTQFVKKNFEQSYVWDAIEKIYKK
uniref:glycosyltransferase family 4 protein n=1 Tax=Ornithobacterium rhinotracheale TaxID=28251 RepID=UPI0039A44364